LAVLSIALHATAQTLTFTNLHSFSVFTAGANPEGGLVAGTGGDLYGTTFNGGTNGGMGTLFKVSTTGVVTPLYSFSGGIDGANPSASLTLGSDGNFFGTASAGGKYGDGVIFEMTPAGVFSVLATFNDGNGSTPVAGLTAAPDGSFYGVTENGGASESGTVFNVSREGVLTTLYSFTGGNDGASPVGNLALGTDGNLYGTAPGGGDYTNGVVFQVTTNGVLTVLYSFGVAIDINGNAIDGSAPQAGLVRGDDGYFYGTTSGGGANTWGTVFQISPGGILNTLYSLGSVTDANGDPLDGANPLASLIEGPDGNYYGTTQSGGSTGNGTVFSVDSDGNLTTLYSFLGGDDGSGPQAPLIYDGGVFYGAAASGGGGGNGTLFEIPLNGSFAILRTFPGTDDGGNPSAEFMQGADGSFYGTTEDGGATGNGTIFKYDPRGVFSVLVEFDGLSGASPECQLVQAADGSLLGTTSSGGDNGIGTIFSVTTNGDYALLYSFGTLVDAFGDPLDGSTPWAGLTLGPDGKYYGTASGGGAFDVQSGGDGSIFRISTGGVFETVASFNQANGSDPLAGLILASDGNFYGTASAGGASDNGTVFQLTPDGVLTRLHSFTGGADGASPQARLTEVTNGVLYGTTSSGGDSQNGTVFKITTSGQVTPVASFTGANGSGSESGLILGPDGYLYGTTPTGGLDGNGVIYKVALTGGGIEVVRAFIGVPDGAAPDCGLVLGSDGALYGEAEYGGAGGLGTIYRLSHAAPAAPTMNPPTVLGGVITISWSAQLGSSYQVQSSAKLATPNWLNLGGTIVAAGTSASVTDFVNPGAARFYRVVLTGQ
jgi:uncharacterized repeat protein (TIGR03803 family)